MTKNYNTENRYQRQLQLKEIGSAGMQKLSGASVLIAGVGGLGSPVAQYLTGSGIGQLGLVDFDQVELSNLHRQVVYNETQTGKLKAIAAAENLRLLNSEITLESFAVKLDAQTALKLFPQYDIIVDGTDSLPLRYLINDACRLLQKPWVFGSVNGFNGQWAVFDYAQTQTDYRNIFPIAPNPLTVTNCTQNGIAGPVPGITGTLQALEVLKYLLGLPQKKRSLFTFDMLSNEIYEMEIPEKINADYIPRNTEEFLNFSYENFCFGITQ